MKIPISRSHIQQCIAVTVTASTHIFSQTFWGFFHILISMSTKSDGSHIFLQHQFSQTGSRYSRITFVLQWH